MDRTRKLRLVTLRVVLEVRRRSPPRRHDAPEVLKAGRAVRDAALVVIGVKETEAILVVEWGPDTTQSELTVACRAVLVIQRSSRAPHIAGIHDEVLVGVGLR